MRRLALAVVLAPAVAAAHPAKTPIAHARSACGVKILPLSVGNQWTYEAVSAPAPMTDADQKARKALKRISPRQPQSVVITVKSIEHHGRDTVITFDELVTTQRGDDDKKPVLDKHDITTTITCNRKKFEISPNSFFFAGEPGGEYGVRLDSVKRSRDTSWKLTKGGIGYKKWREDIVARWTRIPTPGSDANLGSGKLELERSFTPEPEEIIVTKLGTFKTEKIALITTGRVTLDGAPPSLKPMELPANWLTTFWLANRVGVVQVLNGYAQMYQLTAAKLK